MSAKEPSIHAGHRERMRSRFYATKLKGFAPHETLELILHTIIPKKDVNPLAHTLINRFGSIHGVLNAPDEELLSVSGVGPRTNEMLHALNEVINLYTETRHEGTRTILDVEQAVRHVRHFAHQSFMDEIVVLLENRRGTLINGFVVLRNLKDPMVIREIVSAAIGVGAHSLIIALKGFDPHHKPARSQLIELHNLISALHIVNVYTVEVLILSGNHVYSLREAGLLIDEKNKHYINLPSWSHWLAPLQKYPGKKYWHYIPAPERPPRPDQ